MTRDDIIRLAQEANGYISELSNGDVLAYVVIHKNADPVGGSR